MEKLSKGDEQRIITALERAVEMVNTGADPNEALRKTAEENRFTPQIVQRMVEAYNVSKTLSHMKSAEGSTRAASFPLADAASILEKMYPAQVQAPADKVAAEIAPEAYRHPEREDFMTKRREVPLPRLKVSAYAPDPQLVATRVFNQRRNLTKAAETAKSEYRMAYTKVWELAQKAAGHFKYVTHEPFEAVEKRAWARFGPTGKVCMDLIYDIGQLREKRAAAPPEQEMIFDARREPYRSIAALYKAAAELEQRARDVVDAEDKLGSFEHENSDQLGPPKEAKLLDTMLSGETPLPFNKRALTDIVPAQDTAQTAAMGALGLSEPLKTDPREKALADVLDPAHEAAMQGVKVRAMLNDFLTNDPILSSYDPAEVAEAYNQIAQLTPHAAQQPALMRGMLRKMLQQGGVMEPFEAHQMADIEKQIGQLQAVEERPK